MADAFDDFFDSFPPARRFSPSVIPPEQQGEFDDFKRRSGFQETPDFDLPGAFLAGAQPEAGHLPSFGLDGKLLKNPALHPTAHKTALMELLFGGLNIDPNSQLANTLPAPPDRRDDALRMLEEMLGAGNF